MISGNTALDITVEAGGEETVQVGGSGTLDDRNYDSFQAAEMGAV